MGWVSAVVVVVVVMAMPMPKTSRAYGEQLPCNLKALLPCLKSVKGPYPPQPDQSCCGVVMVTNPVCMCSEFVDYKDYPPSYVKNVLAIPKACGRYQLSGYRCGSKHVILKESPPIHQLRTLIQLVGYLLRYIWIIFYFIFVFSLFLGLMGLGTL